LQIERIEIEIEKKFKPHIEIKPSKTPIESQIHVRRNLETTRSFSIDRSIDPP